MGLLDKIQQQDIENLKNRFKTKENNTIKVFEKEYPELSQEFKIIQDEMYRMFEDKNMDYGLKNIS